MSVSTSETTELTKLNEKIKKYEETIKKLHSIGESNKNKLTEENTNLKERLFKKEEECKTLTEKIKSLERKNEDIYKNVTTVNISDINEIKKQFEKEKIILNELLKTYKNSNDEKLDSLAKLNEELSLAKAELNEEKTKNDTLTSLNNAKYDSKSIEIQFYKISTENSSIRSKLINLEEKVKKLTEMLEMSKNDKITMENNLNISLELVKNELNIKNVSYNTLISDYLNTNTVLSHTQEDLDKAKYFNNKYENDNINLEIKLKSIQSELIDFKSENEGLKSRIKGNEIELDTNRKKIKELESKLAEYKLSKQVFEVTYIYLRMPIEGRITFQKEGEQYSVQIHNRTSTRKYSFIDLEITKDPIENNKIIIKFLKENNQEEYFCNEFAKLLEYYEEYKKKAIEVTDFSVKNKNDKTNSEKKKMRVEKQLQDIFDI